MSEESAAAALMGDNGGTEQSGSVDTGSQQTQSTWSDGLDEETSAYVGAKGWKDPSDILNSYRNLEKFAGGSKNLVELPGADADPEAYDNFYNKLGRPESSDKYGLNIPDNADEDLVSWFKDSAHKAGLTDRQAAELFDSWNTLSGERLQAMEQENIQRQEADLKSLKKEWGPEYDSQIDAGRKAVRALGYDQESLVGLEEKLGTGDMLRLFATLGSKMGEDTFVSDDRKGGGFGVTPAVAKQQIADLKMDQNFMGQYLNGTPEALNKMKRLMEIAHG